MKQNKKTIFEVLRASDTRQKQTQREKENPVYRDVYGNRIASYISQKEKKRPHGEEEK